MHSFPQSNNKDDDARRSELLRDRSKKETELQILRNELRRDERDLESLTQDINKLETAITHVDRDITNTKGKVHDIERTGQWHGEVAHTSETNVRALKDAILVKRHNETLVGREVEKAKQLVAQKEEERRTLHEEIRHMEQELEISMHQANVGKSLLRAGGGDIGQLKTNLTRLEIENQRNQTELDSKKREADRLKQKVSRLQSEERTATHELQQMR